MQAVGVAETPLPKPLADNCDGWPAEALFIAGEDASDGRRDATHCEESGRDPRLRDALRQFAGGLGQIIQEVTCNRLKGACEALPILDSRGRSKCRRLRRTRLILLDGQQLVCLRKRQ